MAACGTIRFQSRGVYFRQRNRRYGIENNIFARWNFCHLAYIYMGDIPSFQKHRIKKSCGLKSRSFSFEFLIVYNYTMQSKPRILINISKIPPGESQPPKPLTFFSRSFKQARYTGTPSAYTLTL